MAYGVSGESSAAPVRCIEGQYVDPHGNEITDPITLAHAAEVLDFQREQVSGKHPPHALSPHGLMLEPPQGLPLGTLYKLATELGKIDRTGLPPALSGGSTMSAVLLAFQAAVAYALLTIDGANEGDMWGPPDTVSNIATDSFAASSTLVSAIANWLILHRVINGDVINSYTSAIGQISRGEVSFIEAGNGIRAVLRATAGMVGWYLAFINALPFMYAGHQALGTISDVTGIHGTSWNMVVAGMDGFNQALRTALVARSIQTALSTVCNWRPRYTGLLCGRENPSWRADQVVTLLAANTRRVLEVYKQQQNIKALLAVSESLTKCRGQSDLVLIGWMDDVCKKFKEGAYAPAGSKDIEAEKRVKYVREHFPTLWEQIAGRFAHLNTSSLVALGVFGGISAICCVVYALVQIPVTEDALMSLIGSVASGPANASTWEVASASAGAAVNISFYLDWALNGVLKALNFLLEKGLTRGAWGLFLDALTVLPGAAIARAAGNVNLFKVIASSVAAFAMNLPPIFRFVGAQAALSLINRLLGEVPEDQRGKMQADLKAMGVIDQLADLLGVVVDKAEAMLTSRYLPAAVERARVCLTHSSEVVDSLPSELLKGVSSESSSVFMYGDRSEDDILSGLATKPRNTEITAVVKGIQAAIDKSGASSSGSGDLEASTAPATGGTSMMEISPAYDDDDIYFGGATPAGTVIAALVVGSHVVGSRPPGWGDQEAREAQYSERCNPCNWFNSAMAWCASGLTTKGLNTFFYGEPAAEA